MRHIAPPGARRHTSNISTETKLVTGVTAIPHATRGRLGGVCRGMTSTCCSTHAWTSRTRPTRESPRLCRGGSQGLTIPEVQEDDQEPIGHAAALHSRRREGLSSGARWKEDNQEPTNP